MTEKIKLDADFAGIDSAISKLSSKLSKLNNQLVGESKKVQAEYKKEQAEIEKKISLLNKQAEALKKAASSNTGSAATRERVFSGIHSSLQENLHSTNAAIGGISANVAASHRRQIAENAKRFATAIAGSVLGGGGPGAIIGAGIGSLFKGPLGFLGGAIGGTVGGAIDKGYSDAKNSALAFSDARKAAGGMVSDFDRLRDTVQSLNRGLGITHSEAAELAKQFIKTSNITSKELDTVSQTVGTAVGFARSYGLDPSQGTQFYGTMRQNGIARTEGDNRRLALMIGESVYKGGNIAKMDEVLSHLSSFTSSTSRQSLSEANIGGYLSMLNSLTGTGITGLANSPGNAAAILNTADQSIRGGGASGQGSRNALFFALSRKNPGMSALDLQIMLDQGIFGTAEKAFGESSSAYRLANSIGDERTKAHYKILAANSNGTTLQAAME